MMTNNQEKDSSKNMTATAKTHQIALMAAAMFTP
jgi:hypothetical protein